MTGLRPDPHDRSIGGSDLLPGSSHDRRHALAFDANTSIPFTLTPSAPATNGAGSQAERTVDDVDVR